MCYNAMQDVFLMLWKRRTEIDFSRPVLPYLTTAVRNRSIDCLRSRKSGRYGRPQSSESIFKYTKTRSHPEVFRENNAKRPKPNWMSFRTALLRRRLLAAGVPENKSLPVRCFSGIETKVRESLPHFVSDSQTPPFIYWNTANYPEQQK